MLLTSFDSIQTINWLTGWNSKYLLEIVTAVNGLNSMGLIIQLELLNNSARSLYFNTTDTKYSCWNSEVFTIIQLQITDCS